MEHPLQINEKPKGKLHHCGYLICGPNEVPSRPFDSPQVFDVVDKGIILQCS